MRIKSVDAFRKEVFKNLKEVYFEGCRISEAGKVWIKPEVLRPENREAICVREMKNVLVVSRYHMEEYKEVWDETIYITADDDGFEFRKYDDEGQYYKLYSWIVYDDCLTRMEFAMEITKRIAYFARKGRA